MARSRINSKSKDLIDDNGSILLSIVKGEQVQIGVTLGWLTNLTGYTLLAKIIEANSASIDHTDPTSLPTTQQGSGIITTLPIIDATVSDNTFNIVIPESLINSYTTQPLPNAPSYGWIGLEVADNAVGNAKQIWKPMRGLVEILYSPSEVT